MLVQFTSIIFQNELLDGKKIIQLNPHLNTTRPKKVAILIEPAGSIQDFTVCLLFMTSIKVNAKVNRSGFIGQNVHTQQIVKFQKFHKFCMLFIIPYNAPTNFPKSAK